MQERIRGTLVAWKQDKAYGFIRPNQGGKDVFVHLRDIGDIGRTPKVGDVIWFQRLTDGAGRYRAAEVKVEGTDRQPQSTRRQRIPSSSAAHRDTRQLHAGSSLWIALGFVCVVAGLVALTPLPILVLPIYFVVSLVAFLLYAFDKAAAMNHRWRTTENLLLFVGVIGGWPGALVAQSMFRHKRSKTSFQAAFWTTVVANIAALAWASTTTGAAVIRGLIY